MTCGRKLRLDSMVLESTIHYPTDSRILGDGVRVVNRLLWRAKKAVGEQATLGKELFRSRTRSVRRLAQQIQRVARRKVEAAAEELKGAYRKLIGIAVESRTSCAAGAGGIGEAGRHQAGSARYGGHPAAG